MSLKERLAQRRSELTPKGRQLADFIRQNPRRAVFLRTRALADACGVSEATVIRFVDRLGYKGYPEFIQALRDWVDTELTLVDRVDLMDPNAPENERIAKVIFNEITNLRMLFESMNIPAIQAMVTRILTANEVYVVGSRLSHTFAYYLGWSLTKIRTGVQTLKGSDSTTIDLLSTLPPPVLVIILTTARYPNELVRLAKAVRRVGHDLMVITDGPLSPVIGFAHQSYVVPCQHFSLAGSPSAMHCFLTCMIHELIHQGGAEVRQHQEMLERVIRENDVFFNLER